MKFKQHSVRKASEILKILWTNKDMKFKQHSIRKANYKQHAWSHIIFLNKIKKWWDHFQIFTENVVILFGCLVSENKKLTGSEQMMHLTKRLIDIEAPGVWTKIKTLKLVSLEWLVFKIIHRFCDPKLFLIQSDWILKNEGVLFIFLFNLNESSRTREHCF